MSQKVGQFVNYSHLRKTYVGLRIDSGEEKNFIRIHVLSQTTDTIILVI